MPQLEVLICKFLAIDGFSAGSISSCKISSLNHEILNNAVKGRTLIAEAFFASRKGAKVLNRLTLCYYGELVFI